MTALLGKPTVLKQLNTVLATPLRSRPMDSGGSTLLSVGELGLLCLRDGASTGGNLQGS